MSAIYLSCAWLLGILLGQMSGPPVAALLIGLAPLPFLFLFRRYSRLIIGSSLGLIVCLGAAVYSSPVHSPPDEHDLRFYNGQGAAEVTGSVTRDPDVGPETTHIQLSATNVVIGGKSHKVSGTAMLFVPRYPEYHYGDILRAKGRIETPPVFNEFDYAAFLAQQDVYSVMAYPGIEVTVKRGGAKPLAWVYAARDNLSRSMARVMPEPQASLSQGVTLGLRSDIPKPLMDDFVRSGTAHLLAISGVNLTIVAGMLVALTVWLLGRRHYIYIWITLIIVWLYAWLTGLQPPVLRAAIMFSFFLAADFLGRQRSGVTALFLAAALMAGISPKALFDASFQMSFVAMAGLIFICPPMQSVSKNLVERFIGGGRVGSIAYVIAESLSVSAGAVIATWPLIAYHFALFSWVGPLATSVTLPVMPAIIITSALAGGLGLLALPLGHIIGWTAWLPLSYLVLTVKAFGAVPGAALQTGQITPVLIGGYYVGLTVMVLSYHRRERVKEIATKASVAVSSLPKKWAIPPLALLAVVVWLVVSSMPDDNLHVNFLNIGQGDAILIEKGHEQILVDGGPSPQDAILEISKKMPFWDRTIETVVLTHPDADHLAGLVEVLKRYDVERVLAANLTDDSALFHEWMNAINTGHIDYLPVEAGQQISIGKEVTISVLNPPVPALSGTESDLNNNSVVLRVSDGKVSILLTGDLETEGEMELITQRANLASTILKVGHHGSASSTSQEFLSVVDPQIAVISVGKDNAFGHPNPQVLDRLTQQLGPENVYRTDQIGTIEFITNGERLWVKTGG